MREEDCIWSLDQHASSAKTKSALSVGKETKQTKIETNGIKSKAKLQKMRLKKDLKFNLVHVVHQ